MYELQGNPLVESLRSLKSNFKIGYNANRIALAMLRRIMQRIRNIELIRSVREWTSQFQREKLLNGMQQTSVESLLDELAAAKKEGGTALLRLIYKKMQNAVFARHVMSWKKNRSCEILEGKIDGGGLAFLQDAKLKEEQRQREEESKIRAERLTRQREIEKRDAGLRMMRRIRRRMEGDVRVHYTGDMVRNFRDWQNEERKRLLALGKLRSIMYELQGSFIGHGFRTLRWNWIGEVVENAVKLRPGQVVQDYSQLRLNACRHGAVGMLRIIFKNILQSVVLRMITAWKDTVAKERLQSKIAGARRMVNDKRSKVVGASVQRARRTETYSTAEAHETTDMQIVKKRSDTSSFTEGSSEYERNAMQHGAVGMITIILRNMLRSSILRMLISWRDNKAVHRLQSKIADARQMVNDRRGAQRNKLTGGSTQQRAKHPEGYYISDPEPDKYVAEKKRADEAEAKALRLSKVMMLTYKSLQAKGV